jgi:hypothetical protein
MNHADLKALRVDTEKNQVRVLVAGRASYFNGLVAVEDDPNKPGENMLYKTAILIPKDAPKALHAVLIQAVRDAVDIGIAKKWGGKRPQILQLPINDGDIKAQDDPDKYAEYAGNFHITAKKRGSAPIIKAYGKRVETAGVVESGDWLVFDINLYPFKNRKVGVAIGFNGATLIKEGERFGGGPSEDSIDNAAKELYGNVLSSKKGEDSLDDILGGMSGNSDNDDLMSLL